MATTTWSSRIRHDSDAVFREWGSDFAAKLALIGLVQTADTGQINWVTVTRAGVNSNAGYEIWQFNDALQSTAPIFIRFDYGTGAQTAQPRLQATVGTGSNGSGTITGTALTTAQLMASAINSGGTFTSDTSIPSYFCLKDGQLSLAFKCIGTNKSTTTGTGMFLGIYRTCDSSGAPTATAAQVVWGNTDSLHITQALRFAATAATYAVRTTAADAAIGFMAQSQASSIIGSDFQVALAFTITPRMEPLFGICGCLTVEVAEASTFSVALVGLTPRTYLRLPAVTGPVGPLPTSTTGGMVKCVLWE